MTSEEKRIIDFIEEKIKRYKSEYDMAWNHNSSEKEFKFCMELQEIKDFMIMKHIVDVSKYKKMG